MSNFLLDQAGKLVAKSVGKLVPKGGPAGLIANTSVASAKQATSLQSMQADEADPRIRLQARSRQQSILYGPKNSRDHILNPLWTTNGLLFPYTPVITTNFSVEYSKYDPVHAIQEFMAYQRTPAPVFGIAGLFTAQNLAEAKYALAVIHFLRTISKMVFGIGSAQQPLGLTPPVLLLNGYGSLMFNNLPVIMTTYNIELMNNIDYIKVSAIGVGSEASYLQDEIDLRKDAADIIDGPSWRSEKAKLNADIKEKTQQKQTERLGVAWIPSSFMITVSLTVQHTPNDLRKFDIESFRKGNLLKDRSRDDRGGFW